MSAVVPCLGGSPGRWRPDHVKLDPPLLALRWPTAGADVLAPPVLRNDLAYCASRLSGVVALDIYSGRVAWTSPAQPGWGACQLWQDRLWIVPRPGVLVTVDPLTGIEMTSHAVDDLTLEYSVILDGIIVTPLEPGKLGAWEIASGEWRWRVESGWNLTLLSAAGDLVCVAEEHAFAGLDLATGRERWRFDVSTIGKYKTRLGDERLGAPAGHAIVTETSVYCGVTGGLLVALDASTGTLRWEMRVDSLIPWNLMLTPDQELLFLSHDSLTVVDSSTGVTLSQRRINGQERLNGDGPFGAMVVSDEYVWTADCLGRLLAISRRDAEIRFRQALGRTTFKAPVIGNGTLFTVDDLGRLTILSTPDSSHMCLR